MSNYDDFNVQLDHDIVIDEDRAQDQNKKLNQPSYEPPQNNEELNVGAGDYNLSNAAHPGACVATVGFKAAAFVIYMLGGFLSTVLLFILVTILSALDFWVVKNVTGRLLVGLRWWSDYDEKGNQIWKFESYDTKQKTNKVDKAFFWTAQLAGSIVWAVMLIIKILSLAPFWALLVLINLALCFINLYGYYKCRGDHNKKLNNLKNEGIRKLAGSLF